jgi:hypothetical protein
MGLPGNVGPRGIEGVFVPIDEMRIMPSAVLEAARAKAREDILDEEDLNALVSIACGAIVPWKEKRQDEQ